MCVVPFCSSRPSPCRDSYHMCSGEHDCRQCRRAICSEHLHAIYSRAKEGPAADSVSFVSSVGDVDGDVHYNFSAEHECGEVTIIKCRAHIDFVESFAFLGERWRELLEEYERRIDSRDAELSEAAAFLSQVLEDATKKQREVLEDLLDWDESD